MQDRSGQEEFITKTFKCYKTNGAADAKISLTGESVCNELQENSRRNPTMVNFHSSICSLEDVDV